MESDLFFSNVVLQQAKFFPYESFFSSLINYSTSEKEITALTLKNFCKLYPLSSVISTQPITFFGLFFTNKSTCCLQMTINMALAK